MNKKASGNGQGQGARATSVLTSAQPQATVGQGAAANGPFTAPRQPRTPAMNPVQTPTSSTPTQGQTQRPRSYSEAASGDTAARQTVRDSINHQSSTGAQITALTETRWREAMAQAFGMSTSASQASADSRLRTQSLGDAPSRGPGNIGN